MFYDKHMIQTRKQKQAITIGISMELWCMGRVLSQTTLEQLKKEKVRNFCKFLLNLKIDSCQGVCSVLCKGS